MTDKWAEHKQNFCGCKDASRLNRCQGRNNCELPEGHPERVSAAPRQPEGDTEQNWQQDYLDLHSMYTDAQRAIAELREERDTLRQQLAGSDAALRESRSNDQAAMGHLADMRQQRDKLAKILRDLVPGCKWRIMRPRIDAALAEIDNGNE